MERGWLEQKQEFYTIEDNRKAVEPVFNIALFLFAFFLLLVSYVQFQGKKEPFFEWFNLGLGLFSLGFFFFRKHFSPLFKSLYLVVLGMVSIVLSFWDKGVASTGPVLLATIYMLSLVCFNLRLSMTFVAFVMAGITAQAFCVRQGIMHFDINLAHRLNDFGFWIPAILNLGAFFILSTALIHILKNRMVGHFHSQQELLEDLKNRKEQLEYIAFHDPLTGLKNRNSFLSLLKNKDREKTQEWGYVFLVDIRNFSTINSLLGPKTADRVLQILVVDIANELSVPHVFCRLGGDRFAIWTAYINKQQARERIEEFRSKIASKMAEQINSYQIELYFSGAEYRGWEEGHTALGCLENAELAMMVCKQQKKSGFLFYEDEVVQQEEENRALKTELEKAMEKKDFCILYQRKVDVRTERTIGLEALSRLLGKDGHFISPGAFIPVLRENNMMVPFGFTVLELVFQDFSRLAKLYGPELKISVNISPLQFLSSGFPEKVKELVTRFALPPTSIVLEITEDVFVGDFAKIQGIIKDLRNFGLGLSIDDFGCGFSSFSYVGQLEFDELKIDKSFIDNIEQEKKQLDLVASICHVGHTLGAHVVAEGVENQNQLSLLKEVCCDSVQGYYYSRPEPLEYYETLEEHL